MAGGGAKGRGEEEFTSHSAITAHATDKISMDSDSEYLKGVYTRFWLKSIRGNASCWLAAQQPTSSQLVCPRSQELAYLYLHGLHCWNAIEECVLLMP